MLSAGSEIWCSVLAPRCEAHDENEHKVYDDEFARNSAGNPRFPDGASATVGMTSHYFDVPCVRKWTWSRGQINQLLQNHVL